MCHAILKHCGLVHFCTLAVVFRMKAHLWCQNMYDTGFACLHYGPYLQHVPLKHLARVLAVSALTGPSQILFGKYSTAKSY